MSGDVRPVLQALLQVEPSIRGPGLFTSVCTMPYVHFGRSPPAYATVGMNVQIGVERIGFE